MNDRIYLSPPHLDGNERELLLQAFDSNWITTLGPQVEAFEQEISSRIGVENGLALSSGTAALHLALLVLGVSSGDEVICSDFTFVATANAIKYCGARPILIDSDRASWNMDPAVLAEELKVRAKAGNLPKCAIVVDLYGQCADYTRILRTFVKYDIPVIEDAAEALGASFEGRSAGTFGLMSILSFNGNKIITTSGGGMLLSANKGLIEKARYLATQARESVPYYEHKQVGYNYRLSNLLSALGRGQLQRLEQKVAKRREVNAFYREHLSRLPGISFMPEIAGGRSTFWLSCITVEPVEFGASHEQIRTRLETENIESRHLWKPMHMQQVFRDCPFVGNGVSGDLFNHGLCLPSGSGLSQSDLERIVGHIKATGKHL